MEIGNLLNTENTWNIIGINENRRSYSNIDRQTTYSGDTVDISDEARKLYSRMIHKYDQSGSAQEVGNSGEGAPPGGYAPAGGGSGMDSSSNNIETIKNQIQALKSQIMSLASQAQSGGPGSSAMAQMNALEAQVAALEAQLNEMAAAS